MSPSVDPSQTVNTAWPGSLRKLAGCSELLGAFPSVPSALDAVDEGSLLGDCKGYPQLVTVSLGFLGEPCHAIPMRVLLTAESAQKVRISDGETLHAEPLLGPGQPLDIMACGGGVGLHRLRGAREILLPGNQGRDGARKERKDFHRTADYRLGEVPELLHVLDNIGSLTA